MPKTLDAPPVQTDSVAASEALPPHIQRARAQFPRGLTQPDGGFRFGADTLLLAAFAHAQLKAASASASQPLPPLADPIGLGFAMPSPPTAGPALTGLDLGTGCGAASFALLLLRPGQDLRLTGIDTGPEMLAAAAANACALGLEARYAPLLADARDHRAGACDFVLANPPFRAPGTGKACPDGNKQRARFEGPGGFAAFAQCAARNLRPRGQFFLVHLAERLPELMVPLTQAGLSVCRLVPVQGHAHTPARLVLLQAVRSSRAPFVLAPPLVLYDAGGALTPQALQFCPQLAANPSRGAGRS